MAWNYEARAEPVPPPRRPELPPHVILGEGLAAVSTQVEDVNRGMLEVLAEIRGLRDDLARDPRPKA